MSSKTPAPDIVWSGARIFDGERFHEDSALLCRNGRIDSIVPLAAVPRGIAHERLAGAILAPGFVDAQVNGGGGVMLNDSPDYRGMAAIAAAHGRLGTTALLPTLISDTREKTYALLAAVAENGLPDGVAGLHLEGPHLAPARKGAHLAEHLRPLDDRDMRTYLAARPAVGTLLLTVATEQVTPEQVRQLVDGGIIVSLGHCACTADVAEQYIAAGASGVTHVFNAMAPLNHREPGLAGAALECGMVAGGIIADGHHVSPLMLRLALRAKRGPERLFFVSDAMATVGLASGSFRLDGRLVQREPARDGLCSRLTLADGTLAGSDLDLATAIRFGIDRLELSLEDSLSMATARPARFLKLADRGVFKPGARADMVLLSLDLAVDAVWRSGLRLC